jgi:hypothetical protein
VGSVFVDCGCGPVSLWWQADQAERGEHQCVMGEIVGNSPTLVVGEGQLKKWGSVSPLGLAFRVQ